jgi:hypothetical protein
VPVGARSVREGFASRGDAAPRSNSEQRPAPAPDARASESRGAGARHAALPPRDELNVIVGQQHHGGTGGGDSRPLGRMMEGDLGDGGDGALPARKRCVYDSSAMDSLRAHTSLIRMKGRVA